jgi:subtilisin family serine protease
VRARAPNSTRSHTASVRSGSSTGRFQWALPSLGLGALTPPFVAADGPLLAVIESSFDASHPEFAGSPITTTGPFLQGDHGTSVTSVAAAPANGRGIVGAFPGARVLVSGLDGTCSSAAEAIQAAVHAEARLINMSYGFVGGCYTHYVATNLAYGAGVTLVAAAGNEGEVSLRTYLSPASDPHVVTVAATGPGDVSPTFSNANQAVDVAAPGVDVLAAVPPGDDTDGSADGYMAVSGTSFSAPLVAGGAPGSRPSDLTCPARS